MKRIAKWMLLVLALALAAGCNGDDEDSTGPALDPKAQRALEVGGTPVALAVGEGGVWIADNSGSKLVGVTKGNTDAYRRGASFKVAAGPLAVATGEGAVWAASGDGTVTRLDPGQGEITELDRAVPQPGGIAVGGGSIWVTSSAEDSVYRFDAATGKPSGEIEVGAFPTDVVADESSVWVANTEDGTVTRIDPASGEADPPAEVASQQVLALALGEDGLWVAGTDDERAETIEVGRLDPESEELDDIATEIDAGIPVDLAAGEGGVWATLLGGLSAPGTNPPGRVAVIDPATGEAATDPVRVGARPSGVAVGEGAVWVANAGDGTLTRIDP